MRLEFKRRINTLQLYYRRKRYGEAIQKETLRAVDIDDDDCVLQSKEVQARLKRIEDASKAGISLVDKLLGRDKISDFGSIQEDEDEEGMETKQEVDKYVENVFVENMFRFEIFKVAR
jgi:hypothetical protein